MKATTETSGGGIAYTVQVPNPDPAARRIVRAVFRRHAEEGLARAAVIDYERRVAEERPYEDAVDREEFRRRYGV